jgi:hypothetical protein
MILSPAIRIQVHAAIKAGATLVSTWARGIATLPISVSSHALLGALHAPLFS